MRKFQRALSPVATLDCHWWTESSLLKPLPQWKHAAIVNLWERLQPRCGIAQSAQALPDDSGRAGRGLGKNFALALREAKHKHYRIKLA